MHAPHKYPGLTMGELHKKIAAVPANQIKCVKDIMATAKSQELKDMAEGIGDGINPKDLRTFHMCFRAHGTPQGREARAAADYELLVNAVALSAA